jgi:hypothetical protein
VENISVPSTEIFTNFKNRVIAVPAENKSQWLASKQVAPGSPVEFSDVFTYNMDQYGGDMTAVGVLDDKIVFFKENVKFYVYGSGPAASGANDDFSNPERITGDTGCTNQRSIVSTPVGLFYQSPKGIYLLDRSLSDKYIGSPVEEYSQAGLVTSAVLMADVNQVRMTMDTGITIVYDYFVNQWSVDTGLMAQDSTLWQGSRYALVQSSGRVLVENADIYTDEELLDSAESTGSGIASFANSLPAPSAPHWDTTPNTTSTHSIDIFDGAVTPYFILHSEVDAGSLPVDSLEYWISTSSSSGFTSLVSMTGSFNSGDGVASSNITGVSAGTYYFQARTGIGNRHSSFSTSSIALVWNPQPGRDQGVI